MLATWLGWRVWTKVAACEGPSRPHAALMPASPSLCAYQGWDPEPGSGPCRPGGAVTLPEAHVLSLTETLPALRSASPPSPALSQELGDTPVPSSTTTPALPRPLSPPRRTGSWGESPPQHLGPPGGRGTDRQTRWGLTRRATWRLATVVPVSRAPGREAVTVVSWGLGCCAGGGGCTCTWVAGGGGPDGACGGGACWGSCSFCFCILMRCS